MLLYLLALALLLVASLAPELASAGHEALRVEPLPVSSRLFLFAASVLFLWLAFLLLTRKEKDHTPPSLAALMRSAMLFLLIVFLAETVLHFGFRMNQNHPELLVLGVRYFDGSGDPFAPVIASAIPMSAGRMAFLFAGLGIGLTLFIWIMMRPISLRAFGALSLAGAILLRVLWFQLYPLEPRRADPILQVQAAAQSLLAGEFPYRDIDSSLGLERIVLPGAWLPYIPFVGLGLDLRWWNLLCTVAAFAAIWYFSRELKSWRQGRVRLLASVLILLPMGLGHDASAQSQFFLLAMLAVFLLIHLERWTAGAIVLGVALGTSFLAWVFAPLLGMYLFRRRPGREGLKLAGWAVAIFLVLILPFFLWDASTMLRLFLEPFRSSAQRDSWLAWSASVIGLAALFQWRFLAPVRWLAQWGAVCWVYALAWRRMTCSTTLVAFSIAAYLAAVLLNLKIEMPLYHPVFWFTILYLIFKDSKIDAPESA